MTHEYEAGLGQSGSSLEQWPARVQGGKAGEPGACACTRLGQERKDPSSRTGSPLRIGTCACILPSRTCRIARHSHTPGTLPPYLYEYGVEYIPTYLALVLYCVIPRTALSTDVVLWKSAMR